MKSFKLSIPVPERSDLKALAEATKSVTSKVAESTKETTPAVIGSVKDKLTSLGDKGAEALFKVFETKPEVILYAMAKDEMSEEDRIILEDFEIFVPKFTVMGAKVRHEFEDYDDQVEILKAYMAIAVKVHSRVMVEFGRKVDNGACNGGFTETAIFYNPKKK